MAKKAFLFLCFLLLILSGQILAQEPEQKRLEMLRTTAKTEDEFVYHSIQLAKYFSIRDLVKWNRINQQLENKLPTLKSEKNRFEILVHLCESDIRMGAYRKFHFRFERLTKMHPQLSFISEHRFKLLEIENLIYLKQWEKAKSLAFSHLKEVRSERKNDMIAETYKPISELYKLQNNADSAIITVELGLQAASRCDTKLILLRLQHQQAKIFFYFEKFDLAVGKALLLLKESKDNNQQYGLAMSCRMIADFSSEVDFREDALVYLKRAFFVSESLKDERGKALFNLIQAKSDVSEQLIESAKSNLEQAFPVLDKIQDIENLGNYYQLQGIIALEEKRLKNAESYLNKALDYFYESNQMVYVETTKLWLGKLMILKNDLANAFHLLNPLKERYFTNGSLSFRFRKLLPILAELYEKKNDLKKSLFYSKLYKDYLEKNTFARSAMAVEHLTESDLREEREKLISEQKESLAKQTKQQQEYRIHRDRQLFISISVIAIAIFSLIVLALRYNQLGLKKRQREMELSQSLLRTQMNPHFIFNAMSVIQSSIYANEPKKSSQFLVNFSKLIRLILENSPKEFIPLEVEYDFLEKYLKTQKMRFENRFKYLIHVDELLLAQNALVPPMITQPFVENAIEHGQLHTIEGGKIEIDISPFEQQGEKYTRIKISDNGVGRKGSESTKKMKSTHKSMAIKITTERVEILSQKYKTHGSILIEDLDKMNETGTVVTILLPLKIEN